MTKQLTHNQAEAMMALNGHVGQVVEVLTSGYTANVNPAAVRSAVGYANAAALRGLASKGFVRIVDTYWKGARVEVLKAAEFA